MFISKKHLSRRTLLKGAGASVALPMLDAMTPALAQPVKGFPRLGFVYFPHGAVIHEWGPKQTGTDFEYTRVLQPLEQLHDYVTVVTGLRNKAAENGPAPHSITEQTWLSCVAPGDRDRGPNGIKGMSADQIAARVIGETTPLPSLELCGEPGGAINYRTPQQSLPLEGNPRKVFYTMFGQGDTYEERIAILNQSQSLLDYVRESTASLNRKLSPSDRVRVDEYLSSIREVELRIGKLEEGARELTGLPDAPLGPPDDFTELLDIQFEMIALAFQNDQTRIASMRMVKEASMRVFDNLGVAESYHPLSHHQEDPVKWESLIKIQRHQTERALRFAQRLKEMEDVDGNILDNSIILFGSNMGNSDLHNAEPLPSVLIGQGGGVKGGQHLNYPQDTPHARLLHTMLDRSGVDIETFADSTEPFAEI
jgi:hypothetical protein